MNPKLQKLLTPKPFKPFKPFTDKQKLVGLLAITALIPLALWIQWLQRPIPPPLPPPEPYHAGRPLAEWLEVLHGDLHPKDGSPIENGPGAQALRTLGTNALPRLIYSFTGAAYAYRVQYRREHLVDAFEVLGPVAAPAIPELKRVILGVESDVNNANGACNALVAIGPAAVPAIGELMTGTTIAVRRMISARLWWVAEQAKKHRLYPDSFRLLAMTAPVIVPVLKARLNDPDGDVQRNLVHALADFGEPAAVWAPLLFRHNDQNLFMDMDAYRAMLGDSMLDRSPSGQLNTHLQLLDSTNEYVRLGSAYSILLTYSNARFHATNDSAWQRYWEGVASNALAHGDRAWMVLSNLTLSPNTNISAKAKLLVSHPAQP